MLLIQNIVDTEVCIRVKMSAFQIHLDKENAGARPKGSRHVLGSSSNHNRMKSFHSANTPAYTTPRKALGNAQNILNQTPLNLKSGGQSIKPVNSLKPTLNLHKQSVKHKHHVSFKSTNIQDKENIKIPTKLSAPVLMQIENNKRILESDQIDHMSPPEDIKDNRVPPPEERVSNYLDKLISWRPPCLFGILPVSDDEDDEETGPIDTPDIFDDVDALSRLDNDLCSFDEKTFESPLEMLEIDMPYIDETLLSLDDSYSLSPDLGILQLNDSVLN